MKLPELADQIATTFGLSDLRDLCFQLSIDYDDLPSQNKRDRIIALVNYCKNRRKLEELVNQCRKLRPKETWHFDESWYEAKSILTQQPKKLNLRVWIMGAIVFALLLLGLVNFPPSFHAPNDTTPIQTAEATITSTLTETVTLIPTKEPTDEPTNAPKETIPDINPIETPTNTPVPTETPTQVAPTPSHTPSPPTPTYTSTPIASPSFVCADGLSNFNDIITSCRSDPIDLKAMYYFSDREIENRPNYAAAYQYRSEAGYRLSNIERQNGNDALADQYLNRALQDCNSSIDLSPDSALAYYNCGFVYWSVPNRETDTLENIIFNFEKYLELAQISEPSTPAHASYYRLGESYRLKDSCEVALPFYQKALEYAPNEASVDNAQQRIDLCTN